MASGRRRAVAVAGFGLAAVLSSWNPLAAPFGLVVGLVSAVLSIRSLVAGGHRRIAAVGLLLSLLAVAASGVVLALTAGLGRDLGGEPVVRGPSAAEMSGELDAAAERTRASRERARRELEAVDGGAAPPATQPAPTRRPVP
jgi:hypothetical protein